MQSPIPAPPAPQQFSILKEESEQDDDEEEERGIKLPVALEQALALKSVREKMELTSIGDNKEHEVKVKNEQDDDKVSLNILKQQLVGKLYKASADKDDFDDEDDDNDDDDNNENEEDDDDYEIGNDIEEPEPKVLSKTQTKKQEKAKKRRKRKKKKKSRNKENSTPDPKPKTEIKSESDDKNLDDLNVEVEYVQETLNVQQLAPMYRQFARIIDSFRLPELEVTKPAELDVSREIKLAQELSGSKKNTNELKKVPKLPDDYDDDDEEKLEDEDEEGEDGEKKQKLSKRKLKKLTRLSVAELKQLVIRPDVVEMHDVTARDPKLLVQLKAHRNTVPVPRHWCFKRKYLQGKRGIEKQAFELPDFIVKTGIMEMRSSIQEKDDQKTLKAKMRERSRPKLGKIDIDYQKLHDAFFKWQTKPRLSIHGDLYYEGKEYETKLREKKPGDLSDELRTALGMPVGPHAHKVPPPWLIAMQRYGPPPSYPSLRIPGLNAPIPEGCSFGYHAGGWGKPPVDETGKPLYGDVFGIQANTPKMLEVEVEVDKTIWGELESESEEESEEEDEEEEEEQDETGLITPAEGLVTPSGISSIPVGIHTPDIIELRKRKIETEMEGGETPALYQVLPEKKLDKIGGAMMASTHIYDVSAASAVIPPTMKKPELPGTVELALDPSELDLVDTDAMAARYEQQIREQQSHLEKEDLSDMVADHVARQKGKRRKAQQQENKSTKKYKEFKF